MNTTSLSHFDALIPLPLLKDLLVQLMDRAHSITKNGSLRPNDWIRWRKSLEVWRKTLGHLDGPALRLLIEDREVWDTALHASPDPSFLARISEKNIRNQWKDIPHELKQEHNHWKQEGLIPSDHTPSTQWPVLSLVSLARKHGVQWVDAQERFAQAFAWASPSLCKALLEAYPELDTQSMLNQDAKRFLTLVGEDHSLLTLLFSDTHREVSEYLYQAGVLKTLHVQEAQAQEPTLLHKSRTDLKKAKALLELGADPDALNKDGLLADEANWFSTESSLAFHELLQTYRSAQSARIARKRVMATAMGDSPFVTLNELGFFREATVNPIVPSEVGDMGLLSFLHHRFTHPSQRRMATLAHLLSGKRRAMQVLKAEGSLEEGLAKVVGLIAREGGANERLGAFRKAFGRLLDGVNPNTVLQLALRQYGEWITDPELLDTVLSAMGDETSLRPLLEGMDLQTWKAFRDNFSSFLASWRVPPNGNASNSRVKQAVWTRMADALLEVLDKEEECLDEGEKSLWLPCLMTLACGTYKTDHPAYLKVMEWLSSGIQPAWPYPESEAKVHGWLNQRYPGLEAETTARLMEEKVPEAKATPIARRRASRF